MKKHFSKVVAALLLVCMAFGLFAFTACGVTVEISETEISVQVGKTVTLTAIASDGSDVEWSSGDETVATVSNGKVTGKKVGTAKITAAAGGSKAECTVTVTEAVTVTISDQEITLAPGATKQLTATASDNSAITWSTSSDATATVSATGLVTAVAEGEVYVTATCASGSRANCLVKVADPNKQPITQSTESAIEEKNTWFYWTEWSEIKEAYYNKSTETATLSFANNGGNWYNMQLFYDVELEEVGENEGYGVSFTLNSTKAGHITVNQNAMEIKAGDNNITVDNLKGGGGKVALNIVVGKDQGDTKIDIDEATLTISKPVFEKYTKTKLKTPTALAIDAETKVVTVTCEDDDKASGYMLILKRTGVKDQAISIKNGEAIDDSLIKNGEYAVTVQTIGNGRYESSDVFADTGVTLRVSHDAIAYDITLTGESDITAGKFFYWCEHGEMQSARFEDDIATFTWEGHASNWYGVQIFYLDGSVEAGKKYGVSFKLNSTAAGHITVNGEVIEIAEGDNTVTVDKLGTGKASLSVQIGVNGGDPAIDMGAATIIIGELQFFEKQYDLAFGQENDDEWGNKGLPVDGKYYYWNDQNWAGATVTVSEAKFDDGTLTIAYEYTAGGTDFGLQLFMKSSALKEDTAYVLKLKINTQKAISVTVNGQKFDLTAGDNAIEVEFTAAAYTQSSAPSTVSIQVKGAAGEDSAANTLVLSEIVFEEKAAE